MPRGPSLCAARWAGRHHTPLFAGLARRRRIISRSVPGGPTETQPPRVRVQQRPPEGAGGRGRAAPTMTSNNFPTAEHETGGRA